MSLSAKKPHKYHGPLCKICVPAKVMSTILHKKMTSLKPEKNSPVGSIYIYIYIYIYGIYIYIYIYI